MTTRLLMLASALLLIGSLLVPTASALQIESLLVPTASALQFTPPSPQGVAVACTYNGESITCRICGPEEGDSLFLIYNDERKGGSFAFTEVYYAEHCDGMVT